MSGNNTINDSEKIVDIYKLYYGTMLHIAKGILNNTADAEDAVSEAFIRVIKNISKITNINSKQTRVLLIIIVRNISLDMIRKQKHDKTIPLDNCMDCSNSEDIVKQISEFDFFIKIKKCIENLNKNYSDILYLKLFMEYSDKEISEILDIRKENVKVRLSRARKALMHTLDKGSESLS